MFKPSSFDQDVMQMGVGNSKLRLDEFRTTSITRRERIVVGSFQGRDGLADLRFPFRFQMSPEGDREHARWLLADLMSRIH
jgi:hypothetical protein